MAAVTVWRCSSGRVLGGWGPLLCVLLGSLVALLMPLVGVEDECCAALKGMAQLRCQLWGNPQQPQAVQSTSPTVPFTALDVLPQRFKPSKGSESFFQYQCCCNVVNIPIFLSFIIILPFTIIIYTSRLIVLMEVFLSLLSFFFIYLFIK